ncbi:hypothetical protein, partial [Candidatus Neomicrothrix sp.]
NPTVLLSMVELGLGWAVLPDHAPGLQRRGTGAKPTGAKPTGAEVVIIGELIARRLVAVTRTGAPSDPRTERFLVSV